MPNPKGFTLVELLIAVTVLAVISLIGIAVLTGLQASARDAKRREDITNIAKSIESNKNYSTGNYLYSFFKELPREFPSAIPEDPLNNTSNPNIRYCMAVNQIDATPPDTTSTRNLNWSSQTCADLSLTVSYNTFIWHELPQKQTLGSANGHVKSWALCASMEKAATPFCIRSLSQ